MDHGDVGEGLAPPRRILAELLSIAGRHSEGLHWPSSADAVPAFGDALVAFAREVRQFRFPATGLTRYGFEGGLSQDNSYLVKHFARLVLYLLTHMHPPPRMPQVGLLETNRLHDGLHAITVRRLLDWTPLQHADDLAPFLDMTGLEMQRIFGLEPLMVSCWLCLSQARSLENMCG